MEQEWEAYSFNYPLVYLHLIEAWSDEAKSFNNVRVLAPLWLHFFSFDIVPTRRCRVNSTILFGGQVWLWILRGSSVFFSDDKKCSFLISLGACFDLFLYSKKSKQKVMWRFVDSNPGMEIVVAWQLVSGSKQTAKLE